MADIQIPLGGWGRGTWGALAFGEGSVGPDAAIGQSGSVSVETIRSPNVTVSGVESQTNFGGVMVDPDTVLFPGGVHAAGQVGSVDLSIGVDQVVAGVEAVAATSSTEVVIQVDFVVGSVEAAVNLSGVEVQEGVGVLLQGVFATGATSQVLVWDAISPSQNPNYTQINPSQSGSWTEIVPEAA